MLIQLLKAGAALVLTTASFAAVAAPSQVQNPAGSAQQASARVAVVDQNRQTGMIMPLPAMATWPILVSGIGMIGYANRRRTIAA